MRILHIDEQRGWRGGEQQASWLVRGLAQRGHTVFIAGRPGGRFVSAEHGVPALARIAAPFATEFDPFSAARLARIVRTYEIDILHAHTSHAHTAACMARRLAGRGHVVVSRRVDFVPRANAFNRWKYAWPDRFIAVSERVAQVLRAYGVARDRVVCVHSSVDPARLDAPPLTRAELGVPEGVPLIGTAGALVGHKDHANLLAAMTRVVREVPAAHLVIAGEGELRRTLERQRAELGLDSAVTLLGHRADVPRVLRALDLYVSSSWAEGLGTSILEALVCGVPVVAANAGGAAEMVMDGRTGLIVPVRDPEALARAMLRMLREPEEVRAMAEAGRRHALETFSVDRMVEGTLRVYESLIT